jgi:hypothetical protein
MALGSLWITGYAEIILTANNAEAGHSVKTALRDFPPMPVLPLHSTKFGECELRTSVIVSIVSIRARNSS